MGTVRKECCESERIACVRVVFCSVDIRKRCISSIFWSAFHRLVSAFMPFLRYLIPVKKEGISVRNPPVKSNFF